MKNILLSLLTILLFANITHAFSNSLDGGQQGINPLGNNFSNNQTQTKTQSNTPQQSFSPKEHTGFEHQDRQFPSPTMNDSRYNSSCQFGTCLPGGINTK